MYWNWEASTVYDVVSRPFLPRSSFWLLFSEKARKSETSPPKFCGPTFPTAQAGKKRLGSPSQRVTAVGWKNSRGLRHFQSRVCSCSPGMPHILRLLPRAKNSSVKSVLFRGGLAANKMGPLYVALFRARVSLLTGPCHLHSFGAMQSCVWSVCF